MTEEIIINEKSLQAVLKRCNELEQENKRYKQLLQGCPADGDDCGFCEIDKRNKELEQENKEIKEMLSKEPKAMQAFQIAYSGLKKDNEVLWGMVKDYKTALEEIREHSKELLNNADNFEIVTNCANEIVNKIEGVLK